MKKAARPCPICAQAQVEILHHQRFVLPEGHILKEPLVPVCAAPAESWFGEPDS